MKTLKRIKRCGQVASEEAKRPLGPLFDCILHHIDSSQPFTVAGVEEGVGGVVAEPVASGALPQVVSIDLNPLDLAQLHKTVPAHKEREKTGGGGDCTKSPVGLLDEVLQIHTVETGKECAHCEPKCPHAEFEIQQHQGVAVGIEDSTNTKQNRN